METTVAGNGSTSYSDDFSEEATRPGVAPPEYFIECGDFVVRENGRFHHLSDEEIRAVCDE